MIADRHAREAYRKLTDKKRDDGTATWFRQADWFNNHNGHPPAGHIIPPFSTTTIEKGLKSLSNSGFIDARWSMTSPETGKRFKNRRKIYRNRFDQPGIGTATIINLASAPYGMNQLRTLN